MTDIKIMNLPNGWETKKMSQLFDIKSSRRVHQSDWKSSGIPFYRAREVVKLAKDGKVENELYISQELYDEYTKEKGAPKEGDLIVSAVGTLGQCYLVKKHDLFYFKDASVLWFENLGSTYSRYIEYAFKSDSTIAQIIDGSMGATVGTLTISRAKDIEVPLPPLPEQKRIVAILDEAFAAIDKAKANAEQNLKNAKELFESYLQGVFEKKGEGWEEKTIGDICTFKGGGTPSTKVKKYWEGNIPWVSPKDMKSKFIFDSQDHISMEAINNSSASIIPSGSILIVVRSGILVRIVPLGITTKDLAINQDLKALCPTKSVDLQFLYYFLEGNMRLLLSKVSRGATVHRLSTDLIRELPISVPSIKAQQTIVKKLDKLIIETQKLEEIYQQKIDDFVELKKSVLQKAFTGELKTDNNVLT